MTKAHHRFIVVLILLGYVAPSTTAYARDRAPRAIAMWQSLAAQIPIGATVKLRTSSGERMTAVLLTTDESGILVKPATRIPERSRRVSYDDLNSLERYEDRVSFGKYIAIGAAIGGAFFLGLLATAR